MIIFLLQSKFRVIIFFEKSRVSKNKGGIGCYVRNYIHSRKITDFDDLYEEMKIEFLILQLKIHSENVACCVFYKSPHVSPSSFSSSLNTLMKLISCKYRRVILMGDFNINLIYDSHQTTDKEMNECRLSKNAIDFLSMCLSHYLLPLCSIPTRVTATSASLIDNIMTNFETNLLRIVLVDSSDHFMLFSKLKSKLKPNKKKFPQSHGYSIKIRYDY